MRCDVVLQQKRAAEKCVCVWCKFQDVFSTTWPHGLISKGGVLGMGASVWGLSLPSQVTAQVQHVEWKQKLSWLSHCLQLALPLSLSLFSPYFTLSLCCFASFIMLIRFACQHTHNWVWIEGGCEKRDAMMVAATTMGHEWTIVILACSWCAHHTHTYTHNRRDRQHSRHCV